jgi:hypothetical protein
MNRHCHHCGWEWTFPGQPGRGEQCSVCRQDLRVCLNCVSYDPRAAHQCRDRRAEPVADKDRGTFCEYFEFVKRRFTTGPGDSSRESTARDQWRKLFGD